MDNLINKDEIDIIIYVTRLNHLLMILNLKFFQDKIMSDIELNAINE